MTTRTPIDPLHKKAVAAFKRVDRFATPALCSLVQVEDRPENQFYKHLAGDKHWFWIPPGHETPFLAFDENTVKGRQFDVVQGSGSVTELLNCAGDTACYAISADKSYFHAVDNGGHLKLFADPNQKQGLVIQFDVAVDKDDGGGGGVEIKFYTPNRQTVYSKVATDIFCALDAMDLFNHQGCDGTDALEAIQSILDFHGIDASPEKIQRNKRARPL